jgi:hypothetical protein
MLLPRATRLRSPGVDDDQTRDSIPTTPRRDTRREHAADV